MNIRDARKYYVDSACIEFTARVKDVAIVPGRRGVWHVILEHTYFYPTSGGQPHDTGLMNNAEVVDVFVDEHNAVIHVVSQQTDENIIQSVLFPVGAAVECKINAERRFDHMQQHTGQHILSACAEQLFNVDTVGFHLGEKEVTIDLDTPSLNVEAMQQLEQFANQVIVANHQIRSVFTSVAELGQFRLRHAPKVTENIRIVQIMGFDDNACGGTHVRETGQVAQIKLLRTERVRNQVRLSFVCGFRALSLFHQTLETERALASLVGSSAEQLLEVVSKLREEAIRLRKLHTDAFVKLAAFETEAWLRGYVPVLLPDETEVFCYIAESASRQNDLKAFIMALNAHISPERRAVLVVVGCIETRIYIQAQRTPSCQLHVRDWLDSSLASFHFKGGGNEKSAQGSMDVSAGDVAMIRAALHLARG